MSRFISSWVNRVRYSEIFRDTAVLYSVLNGVWGMMAGFLTVPLILVCFSPQLQGYYYTFRSILGVQTLIVLGLGQVIQQFTSHEWAKLTVDGEGIPSGDRRVMGSLADLRYFVVRWYAGIAVITSIAMGCGGYLFIQHVARRQAAVDFEWVLPWFALSIMTGLYLFISPALVFLEGINRVSDVQKIRLVSDLFERVIGWIVMIVGGKLWVFVAGRTVGISSLAAQIIRNHGAIFRFLFRLRPEGMLSWRREILPLQWRYAVTSVAGYVNFSLLNPILFAGHGPEIAGRMGMTWSILSMLWGLSFSIVSTKMPQMSMAVSRDDGKALDLLFKRTLRQSFMILSVCVIAICMTVWMMNLSEWTIGDRFLPLVPTVILSIAILMHHVRNVVMVYIRSHKREPFWVLSILEIVLALVILPVSSGMGGATGLSAGFAVISLVQTGVAGMIWMRFRNQNRATGHSAGP